MVKVKIQKLHTAAVTPAKTHEGDYCYDVVATSVYNYGDGRIKYGLGIALQIDSSYGYMGSLSFELRARSGIHKTGLILSNSVGTIDKGYTGEISAVFYNVIPELPNYKVGDRIGQICFAHTLPIEFSQVADLADTVRGAGGFGSTGGIQ